MPDQMINRWEYRPDPKPGYGNLYWHILLGNKLPVRSFAQIGREKLAGISGLHFTPQRWLHITVLPLGSSERFSPTDVGSMVDSVKLGVIKLAPTTITLNKVLYHPEAIVVKVEHDGILDQVRKITEDATCKSDPDSDTSWIPHVTLAYSTMLQPAGPIVASLGYELPSCEVTVDSITLVMQKGSERLWDWRPIANIMFGATYQQS